MRRQVRQLTLLAAIGVAGVLPGSCAHRVSRATRPMAPARVEADAWVVSLALDSAVVPGATSTARVQLAARAPFHLNDDYPIHFLPTASPGVAFRRARLDQADGLERLACPPTMGEGHACGARLLVEFAVRDPAARVGGVLAFSVCDEARCLIEKVEVTAAASSAPAPIGVDAPGGAQ